MNEYDEEGKEILPQLNYYHGNSSKNSLHSNTASSLKLIGNVNSNKTATYTVNNKNHQTNDELEDTEEEKVNNLEFDSVHAVLSSSKSSTLDNKYKQYSNLSIKTKQQQQQEMITLMRKEIKREIEQLQKSYNVKLNSLCAIGINIIFCLCWFIFSFSVGGKLIFLLLLYHK